eukprot:9147206-Pyramimonas_sp.AAC.1
MASMTGSDGLPSSQPYRYPNQCRPWWGGAGSWWLPASHGDAAAVAPGVPALSLSLRWWSRSSSDMASSAN